jgi:hypothetical protein
LKGLLNAFARDCKKVGVFCFFFAGAAFGFAALAASSRFFLAAGAAYFIFCY